MIAFSSLEKIGFTRNKRTEDDGCIFQTCDFDKNGSYISVINEYDKRGHVIKQIISLNDRELYGEEPTIETLRLLTQIF